MSENASTKSIALLITNDKLTFLTKTVQGTEEFYSEAINVNLPDLNTTVYYDQVEKEIKSNLPLLLYYNDVKVCYISTPVTVVPNEYLTDNLSSFIEFSDHSKLETSSIKLKNVEANLVFNTYSPLNKVLNNLPNLKNATTFHISKFLIDNTKIDSEKNQLFVRLIEQKLELCIYNKGVFTLYNVFDVLSDEDIVYHILNALEQFKMDPNQVTLSLEGGITEENVAFEHLAKYIQTVHVNREVEAIGPKYLLYKIFECE
ncbi:DUF3822 family protein [Faecalibacter macacae]|uniref:DUF3822 family protein n=1 Tax=Faecalibacter macacae TaxID=1859289 RepID=A0A3L9MFT8_9FLAO|nr:DUF3822 family protein [Faecalibacter macacae]RLZ11910.1 DUF3822 family protein [Faecalibacter macacae]